MSAPQIILLILGAGVAAFNYTVFLIISRSNAMPVAAIALTFIIVPVLLIIFFHGFAEARFPKLYEALKWIYISLGLLYSVSFFAFSCFAISKVDTTDTADVFIVFGCKTYGYTPSYALERRLVKAYELLEKNPDSLAVLSGGQGDDETVTEAESMRAYLVNKGIDESRLILEDRSTSTRENIKFSFALLKERGLDGKKISGVSNDFHIKRIQRLAKEYGYTMSVSPAEMDDFFRQVQNLTREHMVFIRSLIIKST